MKKSIWALGLVLACSVSVLAGGFSLKLTGGVAAIDGGDYNRAVQGANDLTRALYLNVNGGLAKLDRGLNLEVEGIFEITPHFGLGLGLGYCSTREADTVGYDWVWGGRTYHDTIMTVPKFFTVPVTLNLHYRVSLVFGVKLDLAAGLGLYICGFDYHNRQTSTQFDWQFDYSWKASKAALGFQGGLGLELPVIGRLSFVLDLFGRWARVGDIMGSFAVDGSIAGLSYSTSGKHHYFWYYEAKSKGVRYSQTAFQEEQPSGLAIDQARKGFFDYTGIAAAAGFKIRL